MFVEKVIAEGFKSYAERTEVSGYLFDFAIHKHNLIKVFYRVQMPILHFSSMIKGFHPHFNAITGLNGSGKSNILDSICFVLGITNLAQVFTNFLYNVVLPSFFINTYIFYNLLFTGTSNQITRFDL
jgi:predicted ATPase